MTAKKNNKKKSTVILLIVLAIVLVGVILSFVRMIKNEKNADEGKKTEVQKLLDKNLDNSYPATEREVVKVYCRIQQQMYSGECSDEQIQGLFAQMRKLYDEELLAENSYDGHYKKLMDELKEYKKNKAKITSYEILQESGDTVKGEYKGKEQALVDVLFRTRKDSDRQKSVQEFVLRKDDDDRWKILGWYKVESDLGEESEDE